MKFVQVVHRVRRALGVNFWATMVLLNTNELEITIENSIELHSVPTTPILWVALFGE